MRERAVQERAFLSSRCQLLKDTQWEHRVVAGGGGRTLISYKQVLPLPWEGCRHRGGGSVPLGKGERHDRRGKDTWARRQSGERKGSAVETSRGECPLNRCQVQVVLGAPPQAPGPPSATPSLRLLRRAEDMTDNTRKIRSPKGRASMWVHSDTTSPSKKPALSAPQEPQVLGAQIRDRGPEGTISRSPYRLFVSCSFEALNTVSSPVPKATSSGRLLMARRLPSGHIPPPSACTPLHPKSPCPDHQ